MAREFLPEFALRQVATDSGGQRRTLDQMGYLLVVQSLGAHCFALPRHSPEQRSVGDAGQPQPSLDGDDGEGSTRRAAVDLNLTPG